MRSLSGSRCRWPARRQLCKSESAAVLQRSGCQRRQRAQIILQAEGWWIRWVNLHTKLRCDERQAHRRLQPGRCKAEVRGDLRPCKAAIIANNVGIDHAPFGASESNGILLFSTLKKRAGQISVLHFVCRTLLGSIYAGTHENSRNVRPC